MPYKSPCQTQWEQDVEVENTFGKDFQATEN